MVFNPPEVNGNTLHTLHTPSRRITIAEEKMIMTTPPATDAWLLPAGLDGNPSPVGIGSVRGDLVRWTWFQFRYRLLSCPGPLHLVTSAEAALTVTCLDPDGLGGWARPETLQAVVDRLRGLRAPAPIPTRPSVALVPDKPMPHWKELVGRREPEMFLDDAETYSQRHGAQVDMATSPDKEN